MSRAQAGRLALAALSVGLAGAQAPRLPKDEVLRYNLNWPTGLSLGELTWSTSAAAGGKSEVWNSELLLEADVPAFPVRDMVRSLTDGDLCSVRLSKEVNHGKRKSEETTLFERASRKAVRETKGGGRTEIRTDPCPRDALNFLHFVRRELLAGRIPPPQTVYFGAAYSVRLEAGGAVRIEVGNQQKDADRIAGELQGPASRYRFELFFGRDAARTLLLAKVPIPIGTLSVELIP